MTDDTVKVEGNVIPFLPSVRPKSERPAAFLDHVDQIVDKLWADQEWLQYVNAITNKNAVTGKWEVDRGLAALRVQNEAKEAGIMDVASAKLSKIMRAIETLLRRDKLGRNQRLALLAAPQGESSAA